MDPRGFDRFANSLCGTGTRRGLVRLLAALPVGVTLAALHADGSDAAAKKKGKASQRGSSQRRHRRNAEHRRQTGKDKGTRKETCRDCCRANGSSCTKKSQHCKPSLCPRSSTTPPPPPSGMRVSAPFTIEAVWTNPDTDHDTYLFVPNDAGATVPSPYIDYSCSPSESICQNNVYPFTCVSQDAVGPGDEFTTVRKLIAGTYEYWIEVDEGSPSNDVTVNLRDASGTVLRSWSGPPNQDIVDIGWHVFNVDGGTGAVTSVDETSDNWLPEVAHHPSTDVCPYE